MHSTRILTALAAAAALALAAGCGSAGDESGGNGTQNGGSGNSSGKDGAITVTDTRGQTALDAPAERVVALEWTYAEDLLALGVTPAGVADIEGYHKWVTAGPRIDDAVRDVGTRQEPSLESIKALDPDLIVTSQLRSESNYQQLQDIAPTLMFDPYAGKSEYREMRRTLQTIATAVGREEQAQQTLTQLDDKIGKARKQLADAGSNGAEVTVARGYSTDGAAVVEILTDSTIPGALLSELSLKNAWIGKADAYGMSKVDVEGLKEVEDSTLVYVAAEDDDVFADKLAGNALWQELDFVRQERVHALDPGTWFFGGPYSAAQVAQEIADALAP